MTGERPAHAGHEGGATLGLDAIRQIAAAHAASDQPRATLSVIDLLGASLVGHCLFSVNTFRRETMEVERLYSSHPAAYPVGGRKQKRASAWGQHVLLDKRVFIGEGDDAIREKFDDHALMRELGVHSIVNVPVVWRGACLGVLNFGCPHMRFEESQIAAAMMFGLTATNAFAR